MRFASWELRTSILLIAFLAGLMGIGVSLISSTLERKAAYASILGKHGIVALRMIGPDWYRDLMKRFGADDSSFYSLTRIGFGPPNQGYDQETPFRDGDLDSLTGTLVYYSDALRELSLSGSLITDRGIANLPRLPKLKLLILDDTRITDDVIPYLERFPSLVEVSVKRSRISKDGLREMARRLPNCKVQGQ